MATRYGGGHGKSGSKKPYGKTSYSWLGYKSKEVELLIVRMAKEGKSPSQIGLILRDSYGIPDARVVIKKRISEFLQSKKLLSELPEDMLSLIKRSVALSKHMALNKQDMTAKRGLELTQSKIRRLLKFYKSSGRIPENFKYDFEKAGMFVE